MKKSLITLLVLGLISCALFVSCNSEVTASQGDSKDLVSVSFDNEGGSKSLTATLEGFNKDAYYWKYAARKADNSGLSSGATATYDEAGALPVSAGNHGLGSGTTPYQVPGFSQGLWDFMLFAYREYNTDTGAYEDLIYSGEAQNVSLTKGGSNTAHVVVNPVSTGNGIIRIGTISFVPKKAGDATSHTKVIEVTNPDGSAVSGITYDSTKQEYTVPAGAYKVTVKFTNSASTIVYAEGYVIATVYPRLKTTVAGDLNELVTYAQFDADLNPDAVNAQAVSDAVTYDASTEAEDVELSSTSTSTEKTVTTTVARADVNSIIEEMAAEQAVPTEASTTSLKLALNVDPTEATQTTVTYEIGMTATLTYKETLESAAQVSEKSVINLDNYIVVEIQMSTGLTQVNVTHSGLSMIQCASWTVLDDKDGTDDTNLAGYYYYDPAGTLYLKTKKFSPFAISYTAPTNYVASVDGVKYSTLEVAIDKADSTNKVTLLTDVALTSTVNTSKTFELDLNGFSIAAKNCRAIHVKEGTLTLSGSGTIAANKAGTSDFSDQSSVIRVGGGTGSSVGLVIGEKVTVSSNYCYGVTVFGNEATQTLEVNGKVKVTGIASAISGNGTNTLEPTTITINSGAEVSAENDYAIYHPQAGTLTINGGTISGKGGIEAKAGTVTVNGGVITATAPKKTHGPYSNGPSTSGYALVAVSNNDYQGPAIINVNRCTIIGPVGKEYDDEAPGATVNVHARIGYEYYPSFAAAYEAAGPADTVTSLEDLNISARINLLKTITVAGDNPNDRALFKVNTGDNRVFSIDDTTEKVVVTLENVYADGSESKIDSTGYARGVSLYNNENVTLNLINSAVSSPYYAINVGGANKAVEINVSDSSVSSGWAALNVWSCSTVAVADSTLSGLNDKSYNSGGWNNFGTIVMNYESPTTRTKDSSLEFSDTTIVAETTKGNRQLLVDLRDDYITLSFKNCVFNSIGTPNSFTDLMFLFCEHETVTFEDCVFMKDGVELTVEQVIPYIGFYEGNDPSTCTITFDGVPISFVQN